MPRSSSIDSMVDAVWAETVPEVLSSTEKRPSLRPEKSSVLVSPSVGRRMKGQRGINGKYPALSILALASFGRCEDFMGIVSNKYKNVRYINHFGVS